MFMKYQVGITSLNINILELRNQRNIHNLGNRGMSASMAKRKRAVKSPWSGD